MKTEEKERNSNAAPHATLSFRKVFVIPSGKSSSGGVREKFDDDTIDVVWKLHEKSSHDARQFRGRKKCAQMRFMILTLSLSLSLSLSLIFLWINLIVWRVKLIM